MARYWIFVGTSTGGGSRGIYRFEWDSETGLPASAVELAAETANPTFLQIHPNGRFLYCVNAVSDYQGERTGAISSFVLEPSSGRLTFLNQQPSGGAGPCHLVLDREATSVLVANYGGGSTASLPLGADGTLGPPASTFQHDGSSVNPSRQEGPHAHSINLDPAGRFAVTADLGLDQILVYRFSPNESTLTPHDPPFARTAPGAGPRHFAFHPSARFGYVINELDSTVTAFAYDAGAGKLSEIQVISTLPEGWEGENYPSEVLVHPSGRFLYGSNRGHDSLAIYRIDPSSGLLTALGHAASGGTWPRNFIFDASGNWAVVGNGSSDNILFFRVNQETGLLSQVGEELACPSPICHKFLSVGG
jgi:6-phosphogluconolactonase